MNFVKKRKRVPRNIPKWIFNNKYLQEYGFGQLDLLANGRTTNYSRATYNIAVQIHSSESQNNGQKKKD